MDDAVMHSSCDRQACILSETSYLVPARPSTDSRTTSARRLWVRFSASAAYVHTPTRLYCIRALGVFVLPKIIYLCEVLGQRTF